MKPDYEKMWKELIYILKAEIMGLSYISPKEERKIISDTILGVVVKMDKIESKYQPKQYTWSEVLEMNPLPNFIKSYSGLPYGIRTMSGKYLQTTDDLKKYIYYYGNGIAPSIQEMQNKWTILSE